MSLYQDLLKKGKEAIEASKIPFKVRKAEKQLEVKIIELESQVADLELQMAEAESKDPLDFDSILKATNNLELKKRELKIAEDLKERLF